MHCRWVARWAEVASKAVGSESRDTGLGECGKVHAGDTVPVWVVARR